MNFLYSLTVGQEDTTEFLKLLKQQYPLIMRIVLTEAFDADMAITLINQAKVCRYFDWSTPEVLVQRSIQQGLLLYQKHKNNPVLLQRQQVEALPEGTLRNPSLAQRLVGRFKALRARFRWF